MSKNDRSGVPGFADPALNALEDNFRKENGRAWADAALAFAKLDLETAQRLLKLAKQS